MISNITIANANRALVTQVATIPAGIVIGGGEGEVEGEGEGGSEGRDEGRGEGEEAGIDIKATCNLRELV